jgi:DNA polymerase V
MPYFLVDCNQFFVSCEQVFNPKLLGKAVVVLSNNDGCVVARSKQAKALGIPMGAPAYQYAALFKEHKVYVFSSNFALYADMSRRVMEVLNHLCPEIEEYSIDEAFLLLNADDIFKKAQQIKHRVQQWTGISVSIGIGETKTLAKVANDLAKNVSSSEGIYALVDLESVDRALKHLFTEEIWGIGKNLSTKLASYGIRTALEFKNLSDNWLRKNFSTPVLRTAWELRGISCSKLEEFPMQRQSITRSRSFAQGIADLEKLEKSIASFTSNVSKKLRQQKLIANYLTVFIATSPFQPSYYANSSTVSLIEPSAYTPLLIKHAKDALGKIYRKGHTYKKAGVILNQIVSEHCFQRDLFTGNLALDEKQMQVMQVLDKINQRFGDNALYFAAQGIGSKYHGKCTKCSPCYTTRWEDLLTIQI